MTIIGPNTVRDEIPMSRTLQTNDWEILDSMWGINVPKRYIFVQSPGFRARKKTAFVAGNGTPTPVCIDYGGWAALGIQTIQVRGQAGDTVHFVQGSGECQPPPPS